MWVTRTLTHSHTPFLFTIFPRHRHNLIWHQSLLEQVLTLGLEGAGGADTYALAAEDAARFGQGLVEERADLGLEAAALEVDGVGVLGIVGAHLDAAPAQDALGVVADEHRVVVEHERLAALGRR